MTFLAPAAFLFALALPVVLAMYLLKRRRTSRVVPSLRVWERFLAESRANSPFQRLRRQLLLLLQLLFVALLVFALARPRLQGWVRKTGLRILVLDASASMRSTDEKPSRFARARAEAMAFVDALPASGVQAVVLVAGASTEVRQAATSDRAALRRALEGASADDSPNRLTDALAIAETLVRNVKDAEVHLFSDGAVGGLEAFATRDLPLVYHRVGQRVRNVGIVRMEVRSDPEDPRRRSVFAVVRNPGPESIAGVADLLLDGAVLESRPFDIASTNALALSFGLLQERDAVVSVRLAVEDDLAVDNEVRWVSRLPQPVKVRLVTKGNRFLEKALRAAGPRVRLEVVPDIAPGMEDVSVTVLDDVLPGLWPKSGGVLAIHAVPPAWFPAGSTPLESPAVIDWRGTHPLLRFVGFDTVQVARAESVATPPWAESLVDSQRSSLLMAGEVGGNRVAWVGFDLLQSTWPLRVGFPIFVANAVEWLDPETRRDAGLQIRPGDAFRWPLENPGTTARIVLPDRSSESVPLGNGATELVFAGTGRQGLYRFESGTNVVTFAANLLDPQETDTRPAESLDLGKRGRVEAAEEVRGGQELWRWFGVSALVLLMLEWWWFHRRT